MLEAFSNADYVGSLDDRCSTGGYHVYLGANPISWSAKKQSIISRSSTESKYRQLAHMVAEISWLCSLKKVLQIFLLTLIIWCDNNSSFSLALNPILHAVLNIWRSIITMFKKRWFGKNWTFRCTAVMFDTLQ
jgi:hypothetical protein